MKITLSQFAGFCDGVRRAFEIVSDLDVSKLKQPVFVLGSLVHNSDVVQKIEEKGIRKIDLETFLQATEEEIGTVIITAHGSGPEIFAIAKKKNIDVIDTTCPKVIRVQRLAQYFIKRGDAVILVGDKNHNEVQGIFEWAQKKPLIVSDEADLQKLDLKNFKKKVVLSQTTQKQEFVDKVFDFIKKKYGDSVERVDTICLATEQRQGEVPKISKENDAVVVIGSPESANSKRLYELAREINSRSVFVERADMLKKDFFAGANSVAVTAGASTPSWIIEEVIAKLKEF